MATALVDSVNHWRKKLDRNPDEDVILSVIRKLSKVPITLEILESTHIGKCIRKLSKREDLVGEKAKAVLKKWREAFTNLESDKYSTNVSKKENLHQAIKVTKHDGHQEKTSNHEKQASHDHKYKQKSSLHSLSQQSPKKHKIENCSVKNSMESSHSQYNTEVKKTNSNYIDYDPHAEGSESYNPECPELFPSHKSVNIRKALPFDAYEPSSLKRKLKGEDQSASVHKSHSKKLKTDKDSYSNSDHASESKKLSEKKDKSNTHKDKSRDNSVAIKTKSDKSKHDKKSSVVTETSDVKKSKSSKTSENKTSKKPKVQIHSSEVFTSSCVSFEDCLGFNDIVTVKKKKSSKSQTAAKVPSESLEIKKKATEKPAKSSPAKEMKVTSSNNQEKTFLPPKPSTKLWQDVPDIISTLPEIQPNYRPLPRSPDFYAPKKKEVLSNEEAIRFTSSRREKTAVYSGRKSVLTEVPTLIECCTRVFLENLDAIEYLGEVPYFLIKPILEKCSPFQLHNIEQYNPQLVDSTHEIWEVHCKRDYKLLTPREHESWRELYMRAYDEREQKLRNVMANISASMSKSNPVRQVKLAYVDSFAKPPRDVARKQAKNGTAVAVTQPVKTGPPSKASPRPTAPVINSLASSSSGSSNSTQSFVSKKPKIAPLMAKTLKSLKQCFRRK